MKITTLLATLALPATILAQSVTVTTGGGNVEQAFYSLSQGDVSANALASWDLGFEINAFNSSILVNTAKGLKVYETNVAFEDWDLLTAPDVANWTQLQNSETHWSAGALTHGNTLYDPLGVSVGWGDYNTMTHTIIGKRIYAIEDPSGVFTKLKINSLASGTYSFTYAGIDGQGQQEATLAKSAFTGKNFGYFNFATASTVDIEPLATDWDLLFTKYVAMVPTPYPVVGVLQNKRVSAMQVDGVPTADATWNSADLDTAINVIGSDWKTYDMSAGGWSYAQDRTYFVQDRASNIWKLVFTGYGGSANGDITFISELVSSVSVADMTYGQLVVYPNPSTTGRVNVVLGGEVHRGHLTLLDQAGRSVRELSVNGGGALGNVALDVADLQAGLYMARLEADGRVFTARIMVE